MPEETGNVANYREVKPEIRLGLDLKATQLMAEDDSFGTDYDEDATYIPAWDGTVTTPVKGADGVYHITTAAQLAGLNNVIATLPAETGIKVSLDADLNLANMSWSPIGTEKASFTGTFDGNGYTIHNVNVTTSGNAGEVGDSGLFGVLKNATVKNLKLENATVELAGGERVGALVGKAQSSKVENCSVNNVTVISGSKVGALVGDVVSSSVKDCSVSNATLAGDERVGGLVGRTRAEGVAPSVTNNVIIDSTVVADSQAEYFVGQQASEVDTSTNSWENVIVTSGSLAAPGVVAVGTSSYEVTSKEGLLNVNDIIADASTGEGRGIKVKLMTDVDLSGETWKPIDNMWIDFDGNGHTISNLKAEAWKAGFFGYLGGGSIKNLTLENVDITGAQAGAFAGSIEGTIDNCVLKGTNTITWAEKHQYDDPNENIEDWNGIGAITGITQPCTVNATIAEGATVTLNYGALVTKAAYVDTLTGYIGTNKGVVTNNGEIIVAKTVSTAAELDAALTANVKDIHVTLANSIDYNLSTGKTLGGADTETITIKGKGADTVLNLSSTYRNYFNDGATLKLEDLTLTNAQTGSHFYDYTTHFSCDLIAKNVTFGKPILLNSGVKAEFSDITINLDKSITYYAMFIMAGADVTIDGAAITSQRGIKIADEDVANPQLTKLTVKNATFNTDKKAAVLVTSTAGAAVTVENIDISKVEADPTNAVWVDEARADYYDLVTVTGGTKAQE